MNRPRDRPDLIPVQFGIFGLLLVMMKIIYQWTRPYTKLVPEVEEDGLLQFTKFAAVGTAAIVSCLQFLLDDITNLILTSRSLLLYASNL